jgi:type I restriction enzyme, S subunit
MTHRQNHRLKGLKDDTDDAGRAPDESVKSHNPWQSVIQTPPPGYKQTETGMIPEDWDVFELGRIVDYTKGFAFKSSTYQSDGIRIVRVSDTTYDSIKDESAVYVNAAQANVYSKWALRENDLIISTVGSKPPMWDSLVGKVIRVEKRYEGSLLNQNAVRIRAKDNDGHKQLLLLSNLRTDRYIRHIETIYRGNANQASITLDGLFRFQLALPKSKEEQRAIAAALSDVDALITALDRLIAKKRDIKQAAMQELLTGKRRLPGSSGEWETRLLPEVCWFQEGPGVRNTQFTHSGVKLLNGTNIFRGEVNLDNTDRFISEKEAFGPYAHFLADAGDIVIASSGITIDKLHEKVAFVRESHLPLCMNTSTVRFKAFAQHLLASYLYCLLMSDSFKKQVGLQATGSAQLNFGPFHISQVVFSLPDLKEQHAIAEVLSDMDAEIAALEQKRDKTRLLKQGMMQELLTGRIRLV